MTNNKLILREHKKDLERKSITYLLKKLTRLFFVQMMIKE